MANPLMNDRSWNQAAKDPGWGAPDPVTRAAPIDDGPISPWNLNRMTVAGTMTAAGVLMVLLIAAGSVGWAMGPDNQANSTGFPGLALIGVLVGFACVIGSYFRPHLAKFLAPIYAIGEGFFLGVVSKSYENYQHGIVVQAWSPLARGPELRSEPVVTELAQRYGRTPAQIVLRWHIELGLAPVPKSEDPQRLRENIDVFDFVLSPDDVARLSALDRGNELLLDPETFGH